MVSWKHRQAFQPLMEKISCYGYTYCLLLPTTRGQGAYHYSRELILGELRFTVHIVGISTSKPL